MRLVDRSIRTQLIVLLFAITTFSICVLGFLGVRAVFDSGGKNERITAASIEKSVGDFLAQTAADTANKNSIIFNDMQVETGNSAIYAKNIFDNPDTFPVKNWPFNQHVTRQAGGQYTNPKTELGSVFIENYIAVTPQLKSEIETTSYLDHLFPQIISNEPNAVALYFMGTQGETRYYPNIDLGNIVPPDYNPTGDPFYTPSLPKNNPDKKVKWSTVYDDPAGNGLLITASKPIYTNANDFIGMIGMDVSLNNIAKNIEDYSPIESSYAFLVDDTGRAVALPTAAYQDMLGRAPKKGEFGADLQKATGDFGTVITAMRQGKSAFKQVAAHNTDLYVAYAPVKGTPFSLGIVAKKSVLLHVVTVLHTQVKDSTRHVLYLEILPIAIAISLAVWFAGYFYIRFITRPIGELTDKTRLVMQGDFKQRISTTSTNEIGKLAAAFNTMTQQLSESYGVLESKVRERTHALDQKVNELRAAKAKDDAILASIGEGMAVTDSSGTILLMNEIAAALLGIKAGHTTHNKIDDYALYDEADVLIPLAKRPLATALATGKKVEQVVHAKTADGKRALSIVATPVIESERIIRVSQILSHSPKGKQIDRMKSDFISIASHQLRTPLSSIKWFSEILMDGDAGTLKPEQADLVQNIAQSTERMNELVSSLLNISRIESGRIIIEPKPTDIKELIGGIINDLRGKIEERQQKMPVTIDPKLPQINLDPHLIGQVYLNLLTNAIKYTPKNGTITLTISQEGDQLVSKISDTGYGIPKTEQSKMFQKFFRATNITKVESDGTGLGMYLVKSIIESSNGKIWFESKENEGTTFWFSLPMSGMKAKAGQVSLG